MPARKTLAIYPAINQIIYHKETTVQLVPDHSASRFPVKSHQFTVQPNPYHIIPNYPDLSGQNQPAPTHEPTHLIAYHSRKSTFEMYLQ